MQHPNDNPDNHPDCNGTTAVAELPRPLLNERDDRMEDQSRVATDYSPRTGQRLALAVLAVALLLGAMFLLVHHVKASHEQSLSAQASAAADAATDVDVVRVQDAPIRQSITLPGETRGWFESTIYARVSGYIGKWMADIGDQVKKGQVLALIETPELDEQLNAAIAQANADESEVKVAEANEAFAETTYKRWKDSPKGVVSEQERDKTRADYYSAAAHLKADQAKVELAKADVKRLTDLADFKEVVAPYDGVITARHIDIGDLVTAGSTSGNTALYEIAQATKIRVYVDVPQSISGDIKDGTSATVTDREFQDRKFVGKVARNSDAIDPAAKTLRVEVDIDNPDMALKPGMYLEVQFDITSNRKLVRVPASAMIFRSSGAQVAVVKNGVVQFHAVNIVHDMGNYVDVDSGVSPGDEVALNISNQVADGDKVNATPVRSAEDNQKQTSQEPPPAAAAKST